MTLPEAFWRRVLGFRAVPWRCFVGTDELCSQRNFYIKRFADHMVTQNISGEGCLPTTHDASFHSFWMVWDVSFGSSR